MVESILAEEQVGFRKKIITTEQIFNSRIMTEKQIENGHFFTMLLTSKSV